MHTLPSIKVEIQNLKRTRELEGPGGEGLLREGEVEAAPQGPIYPPLGLAKSGNGADAGRLLQVLGTLHRWKFGPNGCRHPFRPFAGDLGRVALDLR